MIVMQSPEIVVRVTYPGNISTQYSVPSSTRIVDFVEMISRIGPVLKVSFPKEDSRNRQSKVA
ncbi:hypothetical protein [Acidithiobacillus sp. IBUN Pt1247-S3]|uniref:hypothetical protein n=1 Tax=Acidithiobacillus sp. IBUN Pt1247-S3 TaxID=3166642 RepID=UPI0034E5988D